jgi:hypothetical protein
MKDLGSKNLRTFKWISEEMLWKQKNILNLNK